MGQPTAATPLNAGGRANIANSSETWRHTPNLFVPVGPFGPKVHLDMDCVH